MVRKKTEIKITGPDIITPMERQERWLTSQQIAELIFHSEFPLEAIQSLRRELTKPNNLKLLFDNYYQIL